MFNEKLTGSPVFLRFTSGLSLFYFLDWMTIGALPILIALKFGAGSEIVWGVGLRLVPRILLAPFTATLVNKMGAARICAFGIAMLGAFTSVLPFCGNFALFQLIIFCCGICEAVINPALLTMRAESVPEGENLKANTIFQSVDRFAKIVGPSGTAILLLWVEPRAALVLIGTSMIAASALLFIPLVRYFPARAEPNVDADGGFIQEAGATARKGMYTLFADRTLLWAIVVPALTYTLMLGAMNPFLFWLSEGLFNGAHQYWSILLTAQGAGALIGAAVCAHLVQFANRFVSLLTIYLVASLLEGIAHFALIFTHTLTAAVGVLIAGGIPEMIAYVVYFTLVQDRLSSSQQATFYSLTLPVFDICMIVGTLSGGLYTSGLLGLNQYWAFISMAVILPVVPWLFLSTKQKFNGDAVH